MKDNIWFRATENRKFHVVYLANSYKNTLDMSDELSKFYEEYLLYNGMVGTRPAKGKFRTHTERPNCVVPHSCLDGTKSTVVEFLGKVAKQINKDVVCVILSGHGSSCGELSTLLLEDGQTITLNEIYKILKGKCHQMIFVADTCRSRSPEIKNDNVGTWETEHPKLWILEATKRNNLALQREGTGQLVESCLDHLARFSENKKVTSEMITDFVLDVLKTFAQTHRSNFVMPTYTIQVINGLPPAVDMFHFYTTHLKAKYLTLPQLYSNSQVIKETITSQHHIDCILHTGVPIGDIHSFKPVQIETVMRLR